MLQGMTETRPDTMGSIRKLGWTLRLLTLMLAALLAFVSGAWGAVALWFQLPRRKRLNRFGSLAWCAWVVGMFCMAATKAALWPLAVHGLTLLSSLLWWQTIRPSNQRVWADDVARLLHATEQGSTVVLVNVRDFHWRTVDDYDIRWKTAEYNLDQLASAEAIVSYWDSPAIAHAMISFGFENGQHLVFSVEIRRKLGQKFSSLGGFFKQFEMILVAAEERDIVRVRTNIRGEDDYLYPLSMDRSFMRSLFLSYLDAANKLTVKPRFYNTITSNCTTLVYRMAKRLHRPLPLDVRLLLTGHLDSYLYDNGILDQHLSLQEWRQGARITERARRAGPAEDFSQAIRRE